VIRTYTRLIVTVLLVLAKEHVRKFDQREAGDELFESRSSKRPKISHGTDIFELFVDALQKKEAGGSKDTSSKSEFLRILAALVDSTNGTIPVSYFAPVFQVLREMLDTQTVPLPSALFTALVSFTSMGRDLQAADKGAGRGKPAWEAIWEKAVLQVTSTFENDGACDLLAAVVREKLVGSHIILGSLGNILGAVTQKRKARPSYMNLCTTLFSQSMVPMDSFEATPFAKNWIDFLLDPISGKETWGNLRLSTLTTDLPFFSQPAQLARKLLAFVPRGLLLQCFRSHDDGRSFPSYLSVFLSRSVCPRRGGTRQHYHGSGR